MVKPKGSRKQLHTIALKIYFIEAKGLGEIPTGSPPYGGGQIKVRLQ